ncbi:B3 domain-containing transcription factor VRN1 [Linum perenne]
MASLPSKTRSRTRSSLPSSSSPITNPQQDFFRIILPDTLQLKKLKLPRKFVKRYGSELLLSSTATLSLPNNSCGVHAWKIGVEKDKEEVWFSKGWAEFMDHHSISKGFFLVFHYLGCSRFNVQIFDLTTCSINYPSPHPNTSFPDDVVILDDDDQDTKDRVLGTKRMRTQKPTPCSETDNYKRLECLKASGIVTTAKFEYTISKARNACREKLLRGIEEAVLSQPTHPCFIILISPSIVRSQTTIMVPTSFRRDHIDGTWDKVILEIGRGKDGLVVENNKWTVALKKSKSKPKNYLEMGAKGWRKFKEDNNLEEGDVCLFQLLSPEQPVMSVSIFPAD